MISQEIIEKIRLSVDITDIIREYVPGIKRAGRNFKVCCPFHQERTPSFVISPEKGIFHCFGCGAGGDVFRFVMKMDGLTFTESIQKLGERSGIPVGDIHKEQLSPLIRKRQRITAFLEHAADFYNRCLEKLAEAQNARTYVEKRGITRESIERFKLGYSPSSGYALRDAAQKKGHAVEDLIDAGIASPSRGGNTNLRDTFRGRLMFPIYDTQGRVLAFGGRILDNSLPKYINSSESPVFSKSRVLYGLYQGLQGVREARKIILLEGYTDVIIAHQYGFLHAVAPLGTALTTEHARLLKRYVEEVVLVFDPDTAGKAAAVRAADILFSSGFFVKVALLPDDLDPADFLVKKGPQAFQKVLDTAKDWIEFHLDLELEKITHRPLRAEDKARIADAVLPHISRIENAVYRQEMKRILSTRIDVAEHTLNEELNRLGKPGFKRAARAITPDTVTADRDVKIQEEIIRLLVTYPNLWDMLILSESDFSDMRSAEIFTALYKEVSSEGTAGTIAVPRVIASLPETHASWLSGILLEQRDYQKPERIFQALQKAVQKNKLKRTRVRLEQEICGMVDGHAHVDKNKIHEYQRLIRSLKGGEQHGEA